MTLHLDAFALTLFTVVMAIAAFEDFRRLVIPNLLPVLLCLGWPIHCAAAAAAPSLLGALSAIGCALAVFGVGAALFGRGYLGGGDVKLLSAAALWAGPAGTPGLLLLTGLFGGALALFLLMPIGRHMATAARLRLGRLPAGAAGRGGLAMPVPYGVAIAGAALVAILAPHLGIPSPSIG